MGSSSAASTALRIRAYRPSDFVEVSRLWRISDLKVGPSDSRRELERARRRDPTLFLTAEEARRVVGVVLGRFDGRRGWVNHLAVDPAFRHRRLGSLLMAELERRLARKGCPKVNLHVTRDNRGVVAFYESLGYATRDMVFMEKWLPRRLRTGRRKSGHPRGRGLLPVRS